MQFNQTNHNGGNVVNSTTRRGPLRVLEMGNYVAPAYAGMILAEQGHQVTKLVTPEPTDPIISLNRGRELWDWINHRKTIEVAHPREAITRAHFPFDVVIDNFLPDTLARWEIDPSILARRLGVVWVSLRSEIPGRSFDVVAQARSTLGEFGWIEFWIGDTSFGLWAAMKALSAWVGCETWWHPIYQASCLRKLVEGELVIKQAREPGKNPFEVDLYGADREGAFIDYRGEEIKEPVRDWDWMWANLKHDGTGRIVV